MGCLGEMLAGFLEGLLMGIFADVSTSLMGRIMRWAHCGEQGSGFMIRYADETGGREGLLRESGRRKRMRIALGTLLFLFALGFVFWIIVLLASYAKDFDWVRKNGAWILAGMAALFLIIVYRSRSQVSRRMRGAALPERSLPEGDFEIPGYRNKPVIDLQDAFGCVAALFFILLAVWYYVSGRHPVPAILALILSGVSAFLFFRAHRNRSDRVPLITLTREGIRGPENLLLLWSDVPDIPEKSGVLTFRPGEGGNVRKAVTVSLNQSVCTPEIILYKIRQYQAAYADRGVRVSGKKPAKR